MGPPPSLCSAVVLLLCEDFVSTQYPMEELHLLLEWRRKGSPAKLLPIFHNITFPALKTKAAKYRAAVGTAEGHRHVEQWARDLAELTGSVGFRRDQVGRSADGGACGSMDVQLLKLLCVLNYSTCSSTSSCCIRSQLVAMYGCRHESHTQSH